MVDTPVAFTSDAARSLGGPEWLVSSRLEALKRFAEAPSPPLDEDLWRYGRVGEIDLDEYVPAGAFGPDPTGPGDAEPERRAPSLAGPDGSIVRSLLERLGEVSAVAVVVDGALASVELDPDAASGGTRLSGVRDSDGGEGGLRRPPWVDEVAEANRESGKEEHLPDIFDHLGDAFRRDLVLISVPDGTTVEHPVVVAHLIGATQVGVAPACFPRTVVSLGEGAGATVVEIYVSRAGRVLVAPTTDLSVGDGSVLVHLALQQLGDGAFMLAHQRARAGRDATLRTFTASLGGEYSRVRTESVLAGRGGSAELLATYLGDGTQVHDFRTLQEHGAPRTTSDLVFKGAVSDHARSVYSGNIRMRHGAKGAVAFQTNRNLVLSDGAHADSVPNLDIEENDVRCSHASAVGQIDPEQRFYLESRGVPAKVADRLILLGFFEELWQRLSLASVRAHLVEAVAGRLEAVDTGE